MDYYEKYVVIKISITDTRYLIIYIRFQILLVSKSIGVFLVGAKIIPLIKHWVGGLFPAASYALCGH